MLQRLGLPLNWQLAHAPLKNPGSAIQNSNLPRLFSHERQGLSTIFPRVASKQPNLICFLRESPPVSSSEPASTPSLQGRERFAGIICNLSSIVDVLGSLYEIWFKYFGGAPLRLDGELDSAIEEPSACSGSGDSRSIGVSFAILFLGSKSISDPTDSGEDGAAHSSSPSPLTTIVSSSRLRRVGGMF